MSWRWRYGLAVDVVFVAWALAMGDVAVTVIGGVAQAGMGWPAVAIVVTGVLAFAVSLICLWYAVSAIRGARDDGDAG